MRIYANCQEMYDEEKRNLHEMGVVIHPQTMQDRDVRDDPAYRTKELSPCAFSILDTSDRFVWLSRLGLNLDWVDLDIRERMSSYTTGTVVNPGRAWELRRETWEPFLHGRPLRFSYTYSERFAVGNALCAVIEQLKVNPDTRQAVLPVFNSALDTRNLGGAQRVPCSMHYQFLRRGGGLRIVYVMRSTDFYTHFPYDITLAAELQRFVASEIGAKPERLDFFAGSLHMYAKDAEVVF